MDRPHYSSLLAALAQVPDPRAARGKQLEWLMILGVIASAVLSGQRGVAAIAQWATRQRRPLLHAFQPARGRLPSESTLRRALQQLDVDALEHHVAAVAARTTAVSPAGHAIDGKHVRGAGAHGQPTVLVSLVAHADAHVVAQTAVAHKRHESQAVPVVLAGRDVRGTVLTLDAGLTHPTLARQILTQGGDYLMVVKRNQRQLYDELGWFFDTPPLACDRPWRTERSVSKGHGRLETRTLTSTDDLDDYVRWPGVQQVLRRECERVSLKTGEVTQAVTYGMTSLGATVGTAAVLAALWRGHWTIENRRHYVRDVTLGEDACRVHTGHAPQALAALRNAVISLLRGAGWHNIAAGVRHYRTSVHDALQLLGLPRTRLLSSFDRQCTSSFRQCCTSTLRQWCTSQRLNLLPIRYPLGNRHVAGRTYGRQEKRHHGSSRTTAAHSGRAQ